MTEPEKPPAGAIRKFDRYSELSHEERPFWVVMAGPIQVSLGLDRVRGGGWPKHWEADRPVESPLHGTNYLFRNFWHAYAHFLKLTVEPRNEVSE